MMMGDTSERSLAFRRMTSGDRHEVFALYAQFFESDRYVRAAREPERAIGEALALFIDRPDYGFVWVAFEEDRPVGCATVAYAISLSAGSVVARLDYLYVAPEARRSGVGSELIETLIPEVRRAECARIEAAAHRDNAVGTQFYLDLGFEPTNEVQFSLAID